MAKHLFAFLLCAVSACAVTGAQRKSKPPALQPTLVEWNTGLPPFGNLKVEDFKPALEWAMAHKHQALARIALETVPPTFDNTIAPLERAGFELTDVRAIFNLWGRSFRNEAFDAVEAEMEPRMAAFDAELLQNVNVAQRVQAVYKMRRNAGLSVEQQRLTEHFYRAILLSGGGLSDEARSTLRGFDERLSALSIQYNQNTSAGGAEQAVVLKKDSDLDGLPPSLRDALAAAAASKNLEGAWLVSNNYNSVQAFLSHSTRRELRERVWQASRHRADSGVHDNTAVLRELLTLRGERARLLGFTSYASLKFDDSMMQTPASAERWLAALAKPATAAAVRDIALLQQTANEMQDALKQPRFQLKAWDLRFYEERVREQKFGVNEAQVAQYLSLQSMQEAMFWVAGQLFDLRFSQVFGASVPSPDVSVWSVSTPQGELRGYLLIDAFSRPGKQSGAWMLSLRDQQRMVPGKLPVVSLHYNIARPNTTGRSAISWREAVGLFHEFGHALQALLSDVTFPTLAGNNVATDALEFSSQWMERYVATPEVLSRFAKHETTGEPMPSELVRQIVKSQLLGEGIRTTEMLETAAIDLGLHLAESVPGDFKKFEDDVAEQVRAPKEVPPVILSRQASVLFGGEDYAAQFYSYLWSDALAAELYEAFLAGEGPYDRTVAARLRKEILSKGSSVEASEAYRAFRGSRPSIEALLRKRGLEQ
jgi:peptidyl-dipeptidase Dcp